MEYLNDRMEELEGMSELELARLVLDLEIFLYGIGYFDMFYDMLEVESEDEDDA